ncbi:MAG: hypothetical protein OXG23_11170 [Chloroflexi bacterium]|nr:hypothetical protein [Chloroflexota bacterium]
MSGGGRQNWKNMQRVVRRELLDDVENDTESRHSATAVEDYLSEKLKEINNLDYEAINAHRDSIENALGKEFEIERMSFAGSHARRTDVDEFSDIDLLATFRSKSDLPNSSDEAVALLAKRLRERFPRTSIETGDMAVTVKFTDGLRVQVLPAYREGNTFRIPDVNSAGWKYSNPTAHARRLREINENSGRQVLSTVKLAKQLFDRNGIGLKSYHIENMALKAFEHYSGPFSNRNMLRHLINRSKSLVHQRIADRAGQTADVSDYLTRNDRIQISKKLARLEATLKSDSLDNWRESFDT